MKKKTLADLRFDLGYAAETAKESRETIDTLRAIDRKRFGVERKARAKKVTSISEQIAEAYRGDRK